MSDPSLSSTSIAYIPDLEHQDESHTSTVYCLSSTPSYIISGGKDQSIRVWSKSTHRLAFPPLVGHAGAIVALAVSGSDDGGFLFSGDSRGNIRVWNIGNGGTLVTSVDQAHADALLGMDFQKGTLITASRDQSAKSWHLVSDTENALLSPGLQHKHTLLGHNYPVLSVCMTQDGKRAVSVSGNRAMRIWDVETGRMIKAVEDIPRAGSRIRFIDEETKILAACSDGTICVIDLESGGEDVCLVGHGNVACAAYLLEDDVRIVSASYDGSARVWKKIPGANEWVMERCFSYKDAVSVLKPVFLPKAETVEERGKANDRSRSFDMVKDMVVDEAEGRVYLSGGAIVRWKLGE
ncbi:WD40-repeat-containing domain protein [Clohesyomyces aquaticus]|uniref:Mitochondrial division protein 1 n=1 Tax=Clohesyomyces aquaticus TaxID=1231657 RepID=A0A1Y1ZI81_9PLEO|nr:WD40-repeat-containing domain protein [Clohesyomyces aquaticus]